MKRLFLLSAALLAVCFPLWQKPLQERQTRTFVGSTSDGWIYLVVIDGRFPGQGEGATIPEVVKIKVRSRWPQGGAEYCYRLKMTVSVQFPSDFLGFFKLLPTFAVPLRELESWPSGLRRQS